MKVWGVSKYLFKVFLRNYIFVFGILATVFFSVVTFKTALTTGISAEEYLSVQEFGLLSIAFIVCAINVFNFNTEEVCHKYLIKDRFKYFLGGLSASIKIGLSLLLIKLIPILAFFFMGKVNNIKEILVEFILVYGFAVSISASLATIICFLVKGLIKRLLIIGATIFVTSSLLQMSFGSLMDMNGIFTFIIRTLNVHDDFDGYSYNDTFGFSHEFDFYIDKIIVLIIIAIIFYFIYKRERKLRYKISDAGVIISSVCLIFGLAYTSINSYQKTNGYLIEEEQIIKKDYTVEEYDMRIDIDNKISVDSSMTMNFSKSVKSCELYLSNDFNIDSVKVNDKESNYTLDNGIIKIDFNNELKGEAKIEIDYSAKVIHRNLGWIDSIATKDKVYLSNDIIDWYPRIRDGKESEFTIDLDDEEIISNLEFKNGKFTGYTNEVLLVKANLEKQQIDGYTVYIAPNNNLENDAEYLKARINEIEKGEREKIINDINERKTLIFTDSLRPNILNGLVVQ